MGVSGGRERPSRVIRTKNSHKSTVQRQLTPNAHAKGKKEPVCELDSAYTSKVNCVYNRL